MVLTFYEQALGAGLLALTIALTFRPGRDRKLPLPPSPKSDPVIGHLRCLVAANKVGEHLYYARLREELNSDIISFTVLGQTIIVLNSAKVAYELLDRRSIYADRPELPMATDPNLVDWTTATSFMPYGQRMSGSALLSAIYGYEVTSTHDPFVRAAEDAMEHMGEATMPGNFYVNTVPWLRFFPSWFPGMGWKKLAQEWRNEKNEMANGPFYWTKRQIAQGTAGPSALKTLLSNLKNSEKGDINLQVEEDTIKWSTGTLFGGTISQSAAATMVFILAMTLYPDVQIRAQAEIDTVIGRDRLPEMQDRGSLPYLERMMKEVFRWQPVGPLAGPRACMENDEYLGYRIPKGSTV
ncbi:cytochrome P450 family protein [Ceratobasidium sp. AG-Ba]|nr:cytochrome P450 family protein [Ceratobasidium sp. AG-Ba]